MLSSAAKDLVCYAFEDLDIFTEPSAFADVVGHISAGTLFIADQQISDDPDGASSPFQRLVWVRVVGKVDSVGKAHTSSEPLGYALKCLQIVQDVYEDAVDWIAAANPLTSWSKNLLGFAKETTSSTGSQKRAKDKASYNSAIKVLQALSAGHEPPAAPDSTPPQSTTLTADKSAPVPKRKSETDQSNIGIIAVGAAIAAVAWFYWRK